MQLTVLQGTEQKTVTCVPGDTVLQTLVKHGISLPAACGGNGLCGKCRFRRIHGTLKEPPGKDGWYLACRTHPLSDCVIEIPASGGAFAVLTETGAQTGDLSQAADRDFGIAVDIGTTTIAMALTGRQTGKIYRTYTAVNSQRQFGADVIARIDAANKGNLAKLQKSVREDIERGITQLTDNAPPVSGVAIAANTTMIHLLMGYDCSTLGVYPFTPFTTDSIHTDLWFEPQIPVWVLPSVSTFVGADILSGLYASDFEANGKNCLFIDLGTNGEMVLGNKDRAVCTSVAAGPAFEGGNITCGTGSIDGAICDVHMAMADGHLQIDCETIGHAPPCGICGTGVVAAVAELSRLRLLDETGLLDDTLQDGVLLCRTPDSEPITLFQKDIREIQLAKSAVRAGIETLIRAYGITLSQIDCVLLAGGFGHTLSVDSAVQIRMFPAALAHKIRPVGNSALEGAIKALARPDAQTVMEKIKSVCSEITLSNDPAFQDLFMEYIYF